MGAVLNDLLDRPVAREPTGDEHVAGQVVAGEEADSVVAPHWAATRHVEQSGRTRPTDRRHQQVGIDLRSALQLHAPDAVTAQCLTNLTATTGVDDGHDVNSGRSKRLSRRVSIGVSVPILTPSGDAAALNVYGVADRITPDRLASLIAEMTGISRDTS